MPLRLEEAEPLALKPPPRVKMSEREFVEWCSEEVRAEWVDGEVIVMSPDNIWHNQLAGFLYVLISEVAAARDAGVVLIENIQIRFLKLRRRRQPDIIFIAKERQHIIKTTYIEGPPDLVVEIVSPDSPERDYREKYLEYEAAGVPEYWIVDSLYERFVAYALGQNKRYAPLPEQQGRIASKVLPGLYVKPAWLWQHPLPNCLAVLRELGVLKK